MQERPTEWRIKRPFNWGAMLVGDAEADLDTGLREHGEIKANSSHVWIPVRHAQDVVTSDDWPDDEPVPPFEVHVTVRTHSADHPAVPGEICFEVPSGRISLGDADGEFAFDVAPGSWCLQVNLNPTEHAEHVELHLRPAPLPVEAQQ